LFRLRVSACDGGGEVLLEMSREGAWKMSISVRPVIFGGPMIRALLAGTKTQTRRVVKLPSWSTGWEDFDTDGKSCEVICANTGCLADLFCPYGKPGDRLWVREAWSLAWTPGKGRGIRYLADDTCRFEKEIEIPFGAWDALYSLPAPKYCDNKEPRKVRPSIHMPRWATRIALEICSVRVERLQDISHDDATAEGIRGMNGQDVSPPSGKWTQYRYSDVWGYQEKRYCSINYLSHVGSFRTLWDSINGKKPGCDWQSNPFVWVIEFRKVTE
jgi:hypothetical protein